MPLFFVLSGLFSGILLASRGHGGFLKQRLVRLGIPLIVALFTIQPLLQLIFLYLEADEQRLISTAAHSTRQYFFELGDAQLSLSSWQLVLNHVISGEVFTRFYSFHLWYLFYLLCFSLALWFLHWLMSAMTSQSNLAKVRNWVVSTLENPSGPWFLGLATLPPMWAMTTWSTDPVTQWALQPRLFIVYSAFFLCGYLLSWRQDLIYTWSKRWKRDFLWAHLVLFPVSCLGVSIGAPWELAGKELPSYFPVFRFLAILASSLYASVASFALIGIAIRFFNHHRPWMRYAADSSYWLYLAGLPPIIVLQACMLSLDIPTPIKLLGVLSVVVAGLLVIYQCFIRYGIAGKVLHGPRRRHSKLGKSDSGKLAGDCALETK